MTKTNRADPNLASRANPPPAAAATAAGMEDNWFEVVRGGGASAQMMALNRDNPAEVDERFLGLRPAIEEAVKDHSAL